MRDSFDPEWITPHQAADKAAVSYKTILRAIRGRRLRASMLAGPGGERYRLRIRIEDFDAWMAGTRPMRRSA